MKGVRPEIEKILHDMSVKPSCWQVWEGTFGIWIFRNSIFIKDGPLRTMMFVRTNGCNHKIDLSWDERNMIRFYLPIVIKSYRERKKLEKETLKKTLLQTEAAKL